MEDHRELIVIVEDNKSQALYIDKIVGDMGYDTRVFYHGLQAWEFIRDSNPVPILVVLDHSLPGISGLEILNLISNYSINSGAIFVTSNNNIPTAVEAIKQGAIDFIVKDRYLAQRLPDVIRRAIENRRLKDQTLAYKEALKNSEEKFAGIVNALTDFIALIDVNMNIVWANNRVRNELGQNVVGSKCYRAYHKLGSRCENCIVKLSFKNKETYEFETSMKRLDGSIVNLWCTSSVAATDSDGNPTHVIEVMRDITDRKENEKALIKAKSEAEKASRIKSEFVKNMSHEIRTPLNAILGYTQIIKNKHNNSEINGFLESINRSSHNLLNLLNDILQLSKLESGVIRSQHGDISLKGMLQNFLPTFLQQNEHNKNKLTYKFSDNFPDILRIDEAKIRHILFNIIGNAVKFTQNGNIDVDCVFEYDKDSKKSGTLILNVRDTGIGIRPEKLEMIFEPFGNNPNIQGVENSDSGFGLVIAHKFVKLMGGDIHVESKPQVGTTFTIKFADIQVSNAPSFNSKNTKGAIKALLIGEHNQAMNNIADYLRELSHEVVRVENVDKFIKMTNFETFKLIFVDLSMHIMNNLAVDSALYTVFAPDQQVCIALCIDEHQVEQSAFDEFFAVVAHDADKVKLHNVVDSALGAAMLLQIPQHKINTSKLCHYCTLVDEEVTENNKEQILFELENSLHLAFSEASNTLALSKIKNFADLITACGKLNNISALSNYGNDLLRLANDFRFDGIMDLLTIFPKIISHIQNK